MPRNTARRVNGTSAPKPWEPIIPPESKGNKEVKLDVPQAQYERLEEYGKTVLNGSSVGYVCLAAITHFVKVEAEPALASLKRLAVQAAAVEPAASNGKVEAKKL
jgi:hypothetical protein